MTSLIGKYAVTSIIGCLGLTKTAYAREKKKCSNKTNMSVEINMDNWAQRLEFKDCSTSLKQELRKIQHEYNVQKVYSECIPDVVTYLALYTGEWLIWRYLDLTRNNPCVEKDSSFIIDTILTDTQNYFDGESLPILPDHFPQTESQKVIHEVERLRRISRKIKYVEDLQTNNTQLYNNHKQNQTQFVNTRNETENYFVSDKTESNTIKNTDDIIVNKDNNITHTNVDENNDIFLEDDLYKFYIEELAPWPLSKS
eukprot:UN31248